jgi:hypothetical protein
MLIMLIRHLVSGMLKITYVVAYLHFSLKIKIFEIHKYK